MELSNFRVLERALGAVSLTKTINEAPTGYYLLDLLVINALIEPKELLARESDLLEAVRLIPGLMDFLSVDVPEGTDQLPDHEQFAALGVALAATRWLRLAEILGAGDLALRLIAALVVLNRGKMYTMQNFGIGYAESVDAALR
jgi:hypothetical protein